MKLPLASKNDVSRRTFLGGAALGTLAFATKRVVGQSALRPPNIVGARCRRTLAKGGHV